METITLTIGGMSCGHCIAALTDALKAVDGIRVHEVALGTAEVSFDRSSTSLDDVTSAIERAGYTVTSTVLSA